MTDSLRPLTPDDLAAIRERMSIWYRSPMRIYEPLIDEHLFTLLAEVERLNAEIADLSSLTSAAEEWSVGRLTNLQFREQVEKWQMKRGLKYIEERDRD